MHTYSTYELNKAWINAAASLTAIAFQNPFSPAAYSAVSREVAAAAEVLKDLTANHEKPEFGIRHTRSNGKIVGVEEQIIIQKPFGSLLHFKRDTTTQSPPVLLVAPLSGHYSTLPRGTVANLLPNQDVYITDWANARDVPKHEYFDFDTQIDYLLEFITHLGRDVNVVAICQPGTAVLAATALLSQQNDPGRSPPRTITLMGSPIDTRIGQTEVTRYASKYSLDEFQRHNIVKVSTAHAGHGRKVYPGYLQLTGFLGLNLRRHLGAHERQFHNLVRGDLKSAEAHRKFYREYLAVMDLTEEFYLQTVDRVFHRHLLPTGDLTHKGEKIDPRSIDRTAILTVEGERDDITAPGQTVAALGLCPLAPGKNQLMVPKAGHYGVFHGRQSEITFVPFFENFIREDHMRRPTPKKLAYPSALPAAVA